MRLFLLRHGRTPSNQVVALDTAAPGADLDELGVAQAERAAGALMSRRPDAVYASTLGRAQQTGQPLASSLGLQVQVRDGLREIDAGEREMRNDDDSLRLYFETVIGWLDGDLASAMPGGCTGEEFLARFDSVVAEASAHGSAVLVAHGAAIRTWLALRANDPKGERFQWAPRLGNTDWIEIEGNPDAGWELVEWHTWDGDPEPIG